MTADPLVTHVAEVLNVHRWKTMGVASVECECGEICYGPGLTQFPADEAFRRHVAAVAVAAMREKDTAAALRMTPADAAHDTNCEHFAEAAGLAAQVQQAWDDLDAARADADALRKAIREHRAFSEGRKRFRPDGPIDSPNLRLWAVLSTPAGEQP